MQGPNIAIVFQIVYNANGGHDAVVAESIFVRLMANPLGNNNDLWEEAKGRDVDDPVSPWICRRLNGFTGGITTSASSPEIYDFDVEQITPTVSCEIEVDEPDHIQAKTRKRQKENDKLLEDYKKSILEDKNDRALRKKMDEEEATKKKKVKRKPQRGKTRNSIYQAATKKVKRNV